MLRDFFTGSEAKRFPFNRKAAASLCLSAILSCVLVVYRFTNLYVADNQTYALKVIAIVGLIAIVSSLSLLGGMVLFLYKCDKRSQKELASGEFCFCSLQHDCLRTSFFTFRSFGMELRDSERQTLS